MSHKNYPWIARLLRIAPMLLLLSAIGFAQSPATKPITEKGLADALKIGGLSESELINAIKTRGVNFALTPRIEKSLRSAGASDNEIDAVRSNYRGAAAASVPPRVPANLPAKSGAAESRPGTFGVSMRNGSAWTQLPAESISWSGGAGLLGGLRKATIGLLNGQITGNIAGAHSDTSIHAPVTFLLRLAPGSSSGSCLLLHLHGKHDNREFKAGFGGENSSDEVSFQATKASRGSFEINFTQGSGEYAFILRSDVPKDKGSESPGRAFTFRILE